MSKKAAKRSKTKDPKTVETLTHNEAKRRNIPTAELQSVMGADDKSPIRVAYERRNRDLDPQLVWRGKDEQDWSDLVVNAPPLFIQEKVHPKVLIDDLRRESEERAGRGPDQQLDLFSDFNGLPAEGKSAEFYQHEGHWSNRVILGDSLQVMASLAEREGLRGKVQCIYLDPPYGISFNSNFQWSTTTNSVSDGNTAHITREPEQVKAFRDTWRDGIHSYLTYLRDRLSAARDLLSATGSIFIQIGDENLHRVRALLDEVFGDGNFVGLVTFRKKNMPFGARYIEGMCDYLLWYAKDSGQAKFRPLFTEKDVQGASRWNIVELPNGSRRTMSNEEWLNHALLPSGSQVFRHVSLRPSGVYQTGYFDFQFRGKLFKPPRGGCWRTPIDGMRRLAFSDRIGVENENLNYRLYYKDYPNERINNIWTDTTGATDKVYVVQTMNKVVQRCMLMVTDPGDLVLDPTCGSGTTANVAEQWGRRWITIDTSRVALALARTRIMGARYPYYLLADSKEGQRKEAEVSRKEPSTAPTRGDVRHGFVYERVPHVTLKSIANNAEIDVIWEKWQGKLLALSDQLSAETKQKKPFEEWEIPREADESWTAKAKKLHAEWWEARIARQKEIDASIAAKADQEFLYDKPYEDKKKVRVAGPFTVESLSPHRVLGVDENDELIDSQGPGRKRGDEHDFAAMVLEHLKTAGVQQAHKEDRITFTSITPWPGRFVAAEGRYVEGESENAPERRAAIFIGPEFGTVSRPDLVSAAREAGDAGFDVLVACGFNYDAHSTEFDKLGALPVLKARMNADLHMAGDLKNTGKGNLFVIFGEPDIDILDAADGQMQVKINGVDVFHPQKGEVISDGAEGIACWFIDTDYNEESFFVRQAYFLGANDPYKSLKTTLKAEIDQEAWESLHSDTSRPFDKPKSGRIAVKVINHLGDEVMKVFRV